MVEFWRFLQLWWQESYPFTYHPFKLQFFFAKVQLLFWIASLFLKTCSLNRYHSCRETEESTVLSVSWLLDLHRDSNMGLRCSFYICFWSEMAGSAELVSWQDFVSIPCIRSSQPFSFKNNNKDWPERGGCYYNIAIYIVYQASSFPILKWPFRIVDIAV